MPRGADAAVLIVTVLLIGVFTYYAYSSGGSSKSVHIKSSGEEWIYPLDEERTITLPGPVGNTVIAIEDGSVHVVSSDCREKICVRSGHIHRAGGWIVCLPNRIFIRIEGSEEEEVDAGTF